MLFEKICCSYLFALTSSSSLERKCNLQTDTFCVPQTGDTHGVEPSTSTPTVELAKDPFWGNEILGDYKTKGSTRFQQMVETTGYVFSLEEKEMLYSLWRGTFPHYLPNLISRLQSATEQERKEIMEAILLVSRVSNVVDEVYAKVDIQTFFKLFQTFSENKDLFLKRLREQTLEFHRMYTIGGRITGLVQLKIMKNYEFDQVVVLCGERHSDSAVYSSESLTKSVAAWLWDVVEIFPEYSFDCMIEAHPERIKERLTEQSQDPASKLSNSNNFTEFHELHKLKISQQQQQQQQQQQSEDAKNRCRVSYVDPRERGDAMHLVLYLLQPTLQLLIHEMTKKQTLSQASRELFFGLNGYLKNKACYENDQAFMMWYDYKSKGDPLLSMGRQMTQIHPCFKGAQKAISEFDADTEGCFQNISSLCVKLKKDMDSYEDTDYKVQSSYLTIHETTSQILSRTMDLYMFARMFHNFGNGSGGDRAKNILYLAGNKHVETTIKFLTGLDYIQTFSATTPEVQYGFHGPSLSQLTSWLVK